MTKEELLLFEAASRIAAGVMSNLSLFDCNKNASKIGYYSAITAKAILKELRAD